MVSLPLECLRGFSCPSKELDPLERMHCLLQHGLIVVRGLSFLERRFHMYTLTLNHCSPGHVPPQPQSSCIFDKVASSDHRTISVAKTITSCSKALRVESLMQCACTETSGFLASSHVRTCRVALGIPSSRSLHTKLSMNSFVRIVMAETLLTTAKADAVPKMCG